MDSKLFHTAIHMVTNVIAQVGDDDMQKATPCSEWDVHELLNHILNEAAWIRPLLQGKTIAEVGDALDGDLVGSDPSAAWHRYAQEATEAVQMTAPDVMTHLSYADKPAQEYVLEVGADLVVHGWDLAKAIGAEYQIDDATAAAVQDATKDILESGREAGLIGAALPVDDNASDADKMLAHYGRNPAWKPAV